jgi:hypothetical protein
MCYYYVGEKLVVQNLQNEVRNLEFALNFWEKYGPDLEKGALVTIGALATVFGGAPSGMTAAGSQTGDKLASDTKNEIAERIKKFDNLKKNILLINF